MHPATAHREDLADEAIGRVAAQIRHELGVLTCADEPAKWNLALQALLKTRIGLDLGGRSAGEIAVSIVAEIIQMRCRAT